MSFEIDCVIALRVPESQQGVAILHALKKLHASAPDPAGIEALKALPAPAGTAFAKAFSGESVQRFRLFDFVARGPQAVFSMVLTADMLDTAFSRLLIAFDAAGCRRIEATAKADDLARSYTCAEGRVEYTTERDDEALGGADSDDGDDES
jgi:hypothetical protein